MFGPPDMTRAYLEIELELHVLSEAGGVVITDGLCITE